MPNWKMRTVDGWMVGVHGVCLQVNRVSNAIRLLYSHEFVSAPRITVCHELCLPRIVRAQTYKANQNNSTILLDSCSVVLGVHRRQKQLIWYDPVGGWNKLYWIKLRNSIWRNMQFFALVKFRTWKKSLHRNSEWETGRRSTFIIAKRTAAYREKINLLDV